jgi:uncharacterized protein YyaL (SSP411 family)
MAELEAALASKGEGYEPRTHHLHPDGRPKFINRLIHSVSPYLLQHAHNPVNWYPWGDEAFERAEAENKPVLLSVGYSTCHWCHVMERESFEDEEIAAYINEHYVAIKVDREERPDVDDVYMTAVHVLNRGRGGWPMTLFLTSERQPFFGATYIPPRDGSRGTRTGFLTILKKYQAEYAESPGDIVERAREIAEKIGERSTPARAGDIAGAEAIKLAATRTLGMYDESWGGFGKAPKFPRPPNLEFLLRYAHRSGDAKALDAVKGTLDHMIEGGIHDHVGGGFHRYATDTKWLAPHFEKMLYDNAQLTCVLLDLWQMTGDPKYRDIARETLDYLAREMSEPQGGFYSATDADSPVPGSMHQEEGWFFTWTPDELVKILGQSDAKLVGTYYGVTKGGNFEGRNIFRTWTPKATVAEGLGISVAELEVGLERSRAKLYEHRATRPPPLRDDKILASWNGLAISAFARGAAVLGDPGYEKRARAAVQYLQDNLIDSQGRLLRSAKDGKTSGRAYLDDYAFVIAGLLDLHEATSDARYLRSAIALQAKLDAHHADEAGGYFTTPDDAEKLLTRAKPSYDGAEPSGNSVATLNLLRLYQLSTEERYLQRARKAFSAFSRAMSKRGGSVPKMLVALDFYLDKPMQVYVVTPAGGDESERTAMLQTWRRVHAPNKVSAFVDDDEISDWKAMIPALDGKLALHEKTTAYVCEGTVCQKPTSDPGVFARQLQRIIPYGE